MTVTKKQKQQDDRETCSLISEHLDDIEGLDDTSTKDDYQDFFADVETSLEHFLSHPHAHKLIRKKFAKGLARRNYDATLRRPNIALELTALKAQGALFSQDLLVNSARQADQVEPPNYHDDRSDQPGGSPGFHNLVKNALLGTRTLQWDELLMTWFQRKQCMQSGRKIPIFFDTSFSKGAATWINSELAIRPSWFLAVTAFCGLDADFRTELIAKHPDTYKASNYTDWDLNDMFDQLIDMEKDSRFMAMYNRHQTVEKRLKASTAAVEACTAAATAAVSAAVRAPTPKGDDGGKDTKGDKDSGRRKGGQAKQSKQDRDKLWNALTKEQQKAHSVAVQAAREDPKPPVPDFKGQLHTTRSGRNAGKHTVCLDFTGRYKTCGAKGHPPWLCVLNNCDAANPPPPATTSAVVPCTGAANAPTFSNEFARDVFDILGTVCDVDPKVGAMVAKYKFITSAVMTVNAEGSSTALELTMEDGLSYLFDTGSLLSLAHTDFCDEMEKLGRCSARLPPTPGLVLESCGDGDNSLGYIGNRVFNLAVHGADVPCLLRECTKTNPLVRPIIGLDMHPRLRAKHNFETCTSSLTSSAGTKLYTFNLPACIQTLAETNTGVVAELSHRPVTAEYDHDNGGHRAFARMGYERYHSLPNGCTTDKCVANTSLGHKGWYAFELRQSEPYSFDDDDDGRFEVDTDDDDDDFFDCEPMEPPCPSAAAITTSLPSPESSTDPGSGTTAPVVRPRPGFLERAARRRRAAAHRTAHTSATRMRWCKSLLTAVLVTTAATMSCLSSNTDALSMFDADAPDVELGPADSADHALLDPPMPAALWTAATRCDNTDGLTLSNPSLPPLHNGGTDPVKPTATLSPTNNDGYDGYHNTFEPVYLPTFHPVSAATASMDGVDLLPVFDINTHLWSRHPVAVAEHCKDIDTTAPLYDQLDLSSSALTNPVALATLRDGLSKYGDVFRPNPDGTLRSVKNPDGTTMLIDIPVVDDVPVRTRHFRFNPTMNDIVRTNVTSLQDRGIVSPNPNSAYASPHFCVPKPNPGEWRDVTDFRKLNMKIPLYTYPLCTETDVFNCLGGSTMFSKMDLTSFFYQFKLNDRSRDLTTFVTSDGAFCYNYLPMGIKISPQIAQHAIDTVMCTKYDGPGKHHGKIALGNFVFPYMDDLICFNNEEEDPHHADYMVWIWQQLHKANIQARIDKCMIGLRRISFLGHFIDQDGLHIDPAKVDAVRHMPPPSGRDWKTKLRSILGAANYLRKFIVDFTRIVAPLTELLAKNAKFEWGPRQQQSFKELVHALSTAPVLALPDWNKPFIVRTDASGYGIGATLVQE